MVTLTRRSCLLLLVAACGSRSAGDTHGDEGEGPATSDDAASPPSDAAAIVDAPTTVDAPAIVDAPATADAPAAEQRCITNGTTTTIATNHGHRLTVSKDDVAAGVEKIYDIQGSTAGHTHSATVTAPMFAMLKANTTVMLLSSRTNHDHAITIACA